MEKAPLLDDFLTNPPIYIYVCIYIYIYIYIDIDIDIDRGFPIAMLHDRKVIQNHWDFSATVKDGRKLLHEQTVQTRSARCRPSFLYQRRPGAPAGQGEVWPYL